MNYENIKILLIDDDENYLFTVEQIFKKYGLSIYTIANPEEALKYLKENKVDILLSDFFMPQMTGEEFINKVREFNKEIITILQTGYADQNPPLEMLERLNIQGYFDKTEGLDNLIILIMSAIKTIQLNKEIQQQKFEIDAKEYKNEFLGKFLNILIGEIGEKSFVIIGNIMALKDETLNLSEEEKKQKINNLETAIHSLNDLVKSLEIKNESITINELKNILYKLYEIKMIAKSKELQIKQNWDNGYEIINCKAQNIIYILVDIIEFLIEKEDKDITLLCEKENDVLYFKFCNQIIDNELLNKINKLALEDTNIKIKTEFNQIIIEIC